MRVCYTDPDILDILGNDDPPTREELGVRREELGEKTDTAKAPVIFFAVAVN
jgi:hypothetical protein